MEMIKELAEKNIALVGFGQEGQSLGSFLIKKKIGFVVFDEGLKKIPSGFPKISFVLGKTAFNSLKKEEKNFDLILRSPGVPPQKLGLKETSKLTSPTGLFFNLCPAKIIGVTGTKGKGTTAALIFHILKNSKLTSFSKVWLGGNIGKPVFDFLEKVKIDDLVILELSSFQLLGLRKSPHIGVVLNIINDHLDYHQKISDYIKAKYSIVSHQTEDDFAVINADYLTSFQFAAKTPANVFWFSTKKRVAPGSYIRMGKEGLELVFIGSKKVVLGGPLPPEEIILSIPADFRLIGSHNLENLVASVTVAKILRVSNQTIQKGARTFKGLPHRLEFVRAVGGVKFFDDAYSTNPESTIAALRSFPGPLLNLILGGRSKGLSFNQLAEIILRRRIKRVFLLGENTPEIEKVLEDISSKINLSRPAPGRVEKKLPQIHKVKTLKEAVVSVYKKSLPGEIILLSPASASFDMFKNATERGEIYQKLVKKLKA